MQKNYNLVFCSYGGGTRPWNRAMSNIDPSTEDGLIEVVGLTTYQLVSKFRDSEHNFSSLILTFWFLRRATCFSIVLSECNLWSTLYFRSCFLHEEVDWIILIFSCPSGITARDGHNILY